MKGKNRNETKQQLQVALNMLPKTITETKQWIAKQQTIQEFMFQCANSYMIQNPTMSDMFAGNKRKPTDSLLSICCKMPELYHDEDYPEDSEVITWMMKQDDVIEYALEKLYQDDFIVKIGNKYQGKYYQDPNKQTQW